MESQGVDITAVKRQSAGSLPLRPGGNNAGQHMLWYFSGPAAGHTFADSPVDKRHADEKRKEETDRGEGQADGRRVIEPGNLPHLSKRKGLSGALFKSQRDKEPESGIEFDAHQSEHHHQQTAAHRLKGECGRFPSGEVTAFP